MWTVSSICFYSNILQYSQAEDAQEKYPVCLTPITWQLQTTTTTTTHVRQREQDAPMQQLVWDFLLQLLLEGWSSALNRRFIAAIWWRQWNDAKTLSKSYHRCAACARAVASCAVTVRLVGSRQCRDVEMIPSEPGCGSARLAGHLETRAKQLEGFVRVKTVREPAPVKWDKEKEKQTEIFVSENVLRVCLMPDSTISTSVLIVALAHVLVHRSEKSRQLRCFRSSLLLLLSRPHIWKFICSHHHEYDH